MYIREEALPAVCLAHSQQTRNRFGFQFLESPHTSKTNKKDPFVIQRCGNKLQGFLFFQLSLLISKTTNSLNAFVVKMASVIVLHHPVDAKGMQ